MAVKHPEVSVQLAGRDGNAFAILGRTMGAMSRAGVSDEEVAEFRTEATSADYDHLLRTVMQWVSVDSGDEDDDAS